GDGTVGDITSGDQARGELARGIGVKQASGSQAATKGDRASAANTDVCRGAAGVLNVKDVCSTTARSSLDGQASDAVGARSNRVPGTGRWIIEDAVGAAAGCSDPGWKGTSTLRFKD